MTSIKRRHFLQFAGATLASLGLSHARIRYQSLTMGRALAQETPRKLALLVGINNYAVEAPLQGCINDVFSQRELLIHRFGFNPNDIVTLTDESELTPTRENILQTFEAHLIKQARPGDVVVFHFSGHGSRVLDPDSTAADGLSSTYVPQNNQKSLSEIDPSTAFVSDITGRTLFLLLAGIKTDNLTAVLDSCHSGGGTRGNHRIRSLDRSRGLGLVVKPNAAELEYRQQLRERIGLPDADIQQAVPRGVILASTRPEELAADTSFDGFYAGAFTYALTQQLWQETDPRTAIAIFNDVKPRVSKISHTEQVPKVDSLGSGLLSPPYFINAGGVSADGIVRKRQGSAVELWLGGLPALSFAAFNRGARLVASDRQGQQIGSILLGERTGLTAKGQICQETPAGAIQAGTFLLEKSRAIPADFRLRIGVDPSLNTTPSALAALGLTERVEFRNLGSGEVEYILAKVTAANQADFVAANGFTTKPALGSIGLHDPGLTPLPDSFGATGESMQNALQRLKAKFGALLAARWLKLSLNANSSELAIGAVLKMGANWTLTAAKQFAVRGNETPASEAEVAVEFQNPTSGLTEVPVGTDARLEIRNQENRDLYLAIFVIDTTGELTAIYPNIWTQAADTSRVQARQTLVVPGPEDLFRLVVQEPLGTTEIIILASTSPLTGGVRALQALAKLRGDTEGPQALSDRSLAIASDVLADQDRSARAVALGCQAAHSGSLMAATSELAALSLSFIATNR